MPSEDLNDERQSARDTVFTSYFNMVAADLWPHAIRFAMEERGAATRCRRRVCRASGICHANAEEGKPITCGDGVSHDDVADACRFAIFATISVMTAASKSGYVRCICVRARE